MIRHIDRKRTSTIRASLDGIDLSNAVSKVGIIMKKSFPSDLKYQFGGTNAERQESMMKLGVAILFSVLIIFLLLAAQFENLLQPLVVLLAVPLSFCGVVACLYLWGMSINTLVLVGFIILAGSSVNTSIVLVDFANQLKTSGHGAKESIIEASLKRLRPIIVTTATNIVDLIPMAFAVGEGAFLQKPIAVTLIGGLISSTILVMFVVPSAYVWLESRKSVKL